MSESPACWGCAKTLDPQDHYCRDCGQGQGEYVAWYYQPLGIALLTVFGIGPFTLILVWKSPALSTWGRWLATALILCMTGYLVFSSIAAWRVLHSVLSGVL